MKRMPISFFLLGVAAALAGPSIAASERAKTLEDLISCGSQKWLMIANINGNTPKSELIIALGMIAGQSSGLAITRVVPSSVADDPSVMITFGLASTPVSSQEFAENGQKVFAKLTAVPASLVECDSNIDLQHP